MALRPAAVLVTAFFFFRWLPDLNKQVRFE
jgi:hypothetical protein